MLQARDCLYLAQEPVGADDGGEFRLENLYGNLAVMTKVVRQENGSHATRAELADDGVPAFECAVEGIVHCRLTYRALYLKAIA